MNVKSTYPDSSLDFDESIFRETLKPWVQMHMNVSTKPMSETITFPKNAMAALYKPNDPKVTKDNYTVTTAVKDTYDEWLNDVDSVVDILKMAIEPCSTATKAPEGGSAGAVTGSINVAVTGSINVNGSLGRDAAFDHKLITTSGATHLKYNQQVTLESLQAAVVMLTGQLNDITHERDTLVEQLKKYTNPKTHETFSIDETFDPVSAWDRAMSGLEKK